MGYKKMLHSSLQIFNTIVFNLLSRWCSLHDNLCMGFLEIQGTVQKKPWGVLTGKVGTGRCGPDRVPFRPPRCTNDI